jgi:hypothetical protein
MAPPPYPPQYPPQPVFYHGPSPWERGVKRRFKVALVFLFIALFLTIVSTISNNWYVVESEEEYEGWNGREIQRITLDFGLFEAKGSFIVIDADSGQRTDSEYVTERYGDPDIDYMDYHSVGDQTSSTAFGAIFFLAVFLLVTLVATGSRNLSDAGFIKHIPFIAGIVVLVFLGISVGYFATNMPDAVEGEVSTWMIDDYSSGLGGSFYAFCTGMALVAIATLLTIVRAPREQLPPPPPPPMRDFPPGSQTFNSPPSP